MAGEHGNISEVTSRSGRRLTIERSGDRAGIPVFLLHGTPGSRNGPKPRGSVLYRLGVQLITYDRPGYGGSTRHEGRYVADAAWDIEDIADALGIGRFAVVGRSGGGPHALACAALLGDRVARTMTLVGLAPADAENLNWYDGMVPSNVAEYTAAAEDQSTLINDLYIRAKNIQRDPESLIEILRTEMTEADKRIVDRPEIRRLLTQSYEEALKAGPFGWIDDVLAFRRDWQFDLAQIKSPVRFWHGADDNFAPVSHTRWMAEHTPGSEVIVESDTAHFGAMEILPSLLPWLTDWKPALVGATVQPQEPQSKTGIIGWV
jgi:pimeloyl-ACP methyl ester carboxylesterase